MNKNEWFSHATLRRLRLCEMDDAYGEDRAVVVRQTLFHVRCTSCQKLLAEMVSTPYKLKCPRCKVVNSVEQK